MYTPPDPFVFVVVFLIIALVGATQSSDAAAATAGKRSSNIERTRTYDVSITYDKYYQTPRIWLFGYSEVIHQSARRSIPSVERLSISLQDWY